MALPCGRVSEILTLTGPATMCRKRGQPRQTSIHGPKEPGRSLGGVRIPDRVSINFAIPPAGRRDGGPLGFRAPHIKYLN